MELETIIKIIDSCTKIEQLENAKNCVDNYLQIIRENPKANEVKNFYFGALALKGYQLEK